MPESLTALVHALGERLEYHAYCNDHPKLKDAEPDTCPYCADRAAYKRYRKKFPTRESAAEVAVRKSTGSVAVHDLRKSRLPVSEPASKSAGGDGQTRVPSLQEAWVRTRPGVLTWESTDEPPAEDKRCAQCVRNVERRKPRA